MKIACQAYTWQMAGERWAGCIPEILDAVQDAGYEGFETEFWMLGFYKKSPQFFKKELNKRGLKFAALAYVGAWMDDDRIKDDIVEARKILDYLRNFPGSVLVLAGGELKDRKDIVPKFQAMCKAFNEIGKIGADFGIRVGCHPHSHGDSIFASFQDYERLLDMTNAKVFGFIPDSGHIARTGLDPVEIFKVYASRIIHVHFKDCSKDGKWTKMGKGSIDFKSILSNLDSIHYKGWIVVEEESKSSEKNPALAVRLNRQYMKMLESRTTSREDNTSKIP